MFSPQYVPPPPNGPLVERIVKFVEYAIRNPQFEAFLRQKEAHNPDYAFLFGGEGAPFYAWVSHCFRYNIPWDRPTPSHQPPHPHTTGLRPAPPGGPLPPPHSPSGQPVPPSQQYQPKPPPAAPPAQGWGPPPLQPVPSSSKFKPAPPGVLPPLHPAAPSFTPPVTPPPRKLGNVLCIPDAFPPSGYVEEVRAPFQQVLLALTGQRQQIQASQDWFMQCRAFAPGMAQQMLERVREFGLSIEQQMHVLYLANDVLFRSLSERQPPGSSEDSDPIALAFRPQLGLMMQYIYSRPDASEGERQQLKKMLSFWGEQGIYSLRTLGEIEEVMLTKPGQTPPSLLAAAPAATAPAQIAAAIAAQTLSAAQQPQGGNWGPPAPRPASNWGPPSGPASTSGAPSNPQPPPFTPSGPTPSPYGAGAVPFPPMGPPPLQAPGGGFQPRPPPGPPPPGQPYPSYAQPPLYGARPPQMGYGPYGMDPYYSEDPHLEPRPPAAQEEPPEPKEPKDSLAFPAHFLPHLVREKNKAYMPYTPLNQGDIDEATAHFEAARLEDKKGAAGGKAEDAVGEKESGEAGRGRKEDDPALVAKVRRLFAEYACYRPGFEEIEAVREAVLRGDPLPGATKTLAAAKEEAKARAAEDSLFPRGRGDRDRDRRPATAADRGGESLGFHAGLGARQAAEEREKERLRKEEAAALEKMGALRRETYTEADPTDAFAQYRKSRSQVYHAAGPGERR